LTELGYTPELQSFTYKNITASNILVTKAGPLDTVIVVGAHYDAVGNSPGADDNASGTSLVLALAELFKDKTTRHTIAFQFYAGEEQGLLGSKFYCNNPKWPVEQHLFMLNLDMVGYLTGELVMGSERPDVDTILTPLLSKYVFAKKITLRSARDSDNAPFADKGIPIVFLHTGLEANYHKKTDTADKLNYDGMVAICNYAYELILAIDKYDVPNYTFGDLPSYQHEGSNATTK
jgi:Zn-dependent M28 family amino/carboxypeptidase